MRPLISFFIICLGVYAVSEPADLEPCDGENCVKQAAQSGGLALLQRRGSTAAKVITTVEEGDGNEKAANRLQHINGVPIYNYHRRWEAREHRKLKGVMSVLDGGALPRKIGRNISRKIARKTRGLWSITFPKDWPQQMLQVVCDSLPGAADCEFTGHPDEKGLSMALILFSDTELLEFLTAWPEVEGVEPELVGHEIREVSENGDGDSDDEPAKTSLLSTNQSDSREGKQSMHATDVRRRRTFTVADNQWNLDRLDANDASDTLDGSYSQFATGENVHIYIPDTGIRQTHTEFTGRLVPTIDLTKGKEVQVCSGDDCSDTRGHGTHVAGIAAGTTYGVAKQATIHSVKVINDDGVTFTSWVVRALDWIVQNGERPAVVSMSLGFGGTSYAVETAIDESVAAGITVVVSAGNEYDDACQYSPADAQSAIVVAATTKSDERAGYSNYGPCVDLYAPGSSVRAAKHTDDDTYVKKSGTSMAAPHVAGAAALLLSANPDLTPDDIKRLLLQEAQHGVVQKNMPTTANKLLHLSGEELPTLLPDATEPEPLVINNLFTVTQGDCVVMSDGACVASANYPASYTNKANCLIEVADGEAITVEAFKTEKKYDKLFVNGQKYHGKSGPEDGTIPTEQITWTSDSSGKKTGWKICAQSASGSLVEPAPPPPELIRYAGQKCDDKCGTFGFCPSCGNGNACCKIGATGIDNPSECDSMTQFGSDSKFVCVSEPWKEPSPIKNKGESCEEACDGPGFCDDFCGTGNACCRFNSAHDPPECAWMIGFTAPELGNLHKHECVSPEGPSGVPEWAKPTPPPATPVPTPPPATPAPTAPPATAKPPPPPPPPVATDNCWTWCPEDNTAWSKKCNWNNCKECSDCL